MPTSLSVWSETMLHELYRDSVLKCLNSKPSIDLGFCPQTTTAPKVKETTMKITDNRSQHKLIKFRAVKKGEVFGLPSTDNVYLKVGDTSMAYSLTGNHLFDTHLNAEVYLLDAELVIHGEE